MNLSCCLLAYALGGEISGLIETSGLVAKAVLVILLVFSVASWAIIFSKWGLFRRARVQSNRFMRAFRKSERLQDICRRGGAVQAQPAGRGLRRRLRRIAQAGAISHSHAGLAARHADRVLGRTDAPGEPPALAGDDRRGHAVHRTVRHGVGHHRRLSRLGHCRRGDIARGRARHLGSADHHGCRTVRRHSRRHRLQHVHPAHSRVRRAHGRLQPGADQRSRARPGRQRARGAEAVERR